MESAFKWTSDEAGPIVWLTYYTCMFSSDCCGLNYRLATFQSAKAFRPLAEHRPWKCTIELCITCRTSICFQ